MKHMNRMETKDNKKIVWHFRSAAARILNTFNEIIANKAVDEMKKKNLEKQMLLQHLKIIFWAVTLLLVLCHSPLQCVHFFVVRSGVVVGFVVLQNLTII